jgi:hypothetical protein
MLYALTHLPQTHLMSAEIGNEKVPKP